MHNTKHLASQIAYGYDIETMVRTTTFELPIPCGINEIDLLNEQMNNYRDITIDLIRTHQPHLNQIIFYKSYKQLFITFHPMLYDMPYKCLSCIRSLINNSDGYVINYGNVAIFYKYNNEYFCTYT